MFKKFFSILEKKDKKIFFGIVFLMAIAGFLEILSVGILIPFLSFLLDPALLLENEIVLKYFSFIVEIENEKLIYFLLLCIFVCFFLKAIFFTWFLYQKNKFIFSFSDNLTIKLFSSYITKPYSLYLDDSSHNQLSTCINEIRVFQTGILISGIEFLSELIITFFLIALLFVANPLAALSILFIGLVLFSLFQFFTKKKIYKWGEIRQKNESIMVEKVQQSYNGLKEILIYLKESFFLKTFEKIVRETSIINIKKQTLIDIPKTIIEIFAIIIFIVVIIIIYRFNPNPSYFIPILGLYVGVSFKLMPALNRLIVASQNIRNALVSLDKITDEVNKYYENLDSIIDLKKNTVTELKYEKNIILDNISFKYPSKNQNLFNNLKLEIKNGETIGIKGKSGEGKSTLINMICGFIIPNTGSVIVDGVNINENVRGWRSIIGYIPQSTYLFNGTIKENICFSKNDEINENLLNKILDMSQLNDLINNSPDKENTLVGERGILLSGGQAQRIALARCLYKNPKVLILDEATSSLDDVNEQKILESIRLLKGKKTIIIVSHRESTLSFCDKIYHLENKNLLLKN